jgi:hypothetical protein
MTLKEHIDDELNLKLLFLGFVFALELHEDKNIYLLRGRLLIGDLCNIPTSLIANLFFYWWSEVEVVAIGKVDLVEADVLWVGIGISLIAKSTR